MKELNVEAKIDNLHRVLEFVDEELEGLDCSIKLQTQIDVAVEELFVNIASYAYEGGNGMACIRIDKEEMEPAIVITFIDQGFPYNPLEREDPDVTLSVEQRNIGGLGVFMVKKSMDEVSYKYCDGSNMLTIKKKLAG
ncbi:MAG: ATP-binding protein [Lachnospiraceae bacterium]|nr:ATP-binding protein [Lachnospiraceae bacterium]